MNGTVKRKLQDQESMPLQNEGAQKRNEWFVSEGGAKKGEQKWHLELYDKKTEKQVGKTMEFKTEEAARDAVIGEWLKGNKNLIGKICSAGGCLPLMERRVADASAKTIGKEIGTEGWTVVLYGKDTAAFEGASLQNYGGQMQFINADMAGKPENFAAYGSPKEGEIIVYHNGKVAGRFDPAKMGEDAVARKLAGMRGED